MRHVDQYDFEKNKEEILKLTQKIGDERQLNKRAKKKDLKPEDSRYAWEFELKEYRKRKKREKFFMFGAIMGILSMLLNIILNFERILSFFSGV